MTRWMLVLMAFLMPVAVSAETPPPPPDHQVLVEKYTAAFNAQDVTAMSNLMHSEIQWIMISGAKSEVATDGKDNMVRDMTSYFQGPTKVSSSLSGWSVNGDYVTVIETASWQNSKGERQAQSATAVYQIMDRLIRRVWYFPEQKAK
ncbi:SnoaL-like domain-containing protein [Parasphingorhabdus marina DSM 22363]|uniref:SnoaL-like domain-containing protein n=1 Tax=Parasphingorhabdus marina DSM 22363 TaxID=1123272 RepID=A0A1N6CRQ4_9SPHN|nr:nuclear transport factor 2 family protein [Parasphingorhabdus marina]SIN61165.1 SnoaL-like domain-containing protein [Parasphingorhabdus marina DSM 22363]